MTIRDYPVFDNFGETGDQLAMRQGAEGCYVTHDELGLIERADQIFALIVIDGRLAPDTRIHLRQKSRRHLHVGNTAQIARRGKTGEIADDAASKCEHAGFSLEALSDEPVVDHRKRLEIFVLLAIREKNRSRLESGLTETLVHRIEIELRDGWVGNHRHFTAQARLLHQHTGPLDESRSDVDRVRAIPKLDGQSLHGPFSILVAAQF